MVGELIKVRLKAVFHSEFFTARVEKSASIFFWACVEVKTFELWRINCVQEKKLNNVELFFQSANTTFISTNQNSNRLFLLSNENVAFLAVIKRFCLFYPIKFLLFYMTTIVIKLISFVQSNSTLHFSRSINVMEMKSKSEQ